MILGLIFITFVLSGKLVLNQKDSDLDTGFLLLTVVEVYAELMAICLLVQFLTFGVILW